MMLSILERQYDKPMDAPPVTVHPDRQTYAWLLATAERDHDGDIAACAAALLRDCRHRQARLDDRPGAAAHDPLDGGMDVSWAFTPRGNGKIGGTR